MAITKDSGRQQALVARVPFTFEDLGTAVTAGRILPALDLPVNAIVVGGYLNITTAFVGPTVATVDVGDGVDPDRYTAAAIDIKATGRTALTLTGFKSTIADTIDFDNIQSVAVSSAGAGELVVEYIVAGRVQENQGLDS